MTDIKSLLAERRAKAMGKPLDYFDDQALLAYVDLLEKMIEKLIEQRDRYMKNYHAIMHLPSDQRIEIYEYNQAEVRRMLTEENK